MANKTEITYFVSGRGHFPLDMLRHDEAWPSTEVDSKKIFESIVRLPSGIPNVAHWEVAIRSMQEPTVERWESFSCTVAKKSAPKVVLEKWVNQNFDDYALRKECGAELKAGWTMCVGAKDNLTAEDCPSASDDWSIKVVGEAFELAVERWSGDIPPVKEDFHKHLRRCVEESIARNDKELIF